METTRMDVMFGRFVPIIPIMTSKGAELIDIRPRARPTCHRIA